MGFPGGSDGKESAYNVSDLGLIPGSGRFPGEGNDNPLQYSCLENPMNRGACWATGHGIAKSWTQLSDWTELKINSLFQLCVCHLTRDFPGGSDSKESASNAGDLDWEDTLEKEMATHSNIVAWEIPWTEEPGRLQSMGS